MRTFIMSSSSTGAAMNPQQKSEVLGGESAYAAQVVEVVHDFVGPADFDEVGGGVAVAPGEGRGEEPGHGLADATEERRGERDDPVLGECRFVDGGHGGFQFLPCEGKGHHTHCIEECVTIV